MVKNEFNHIYACRDTRKTFARTQFKSQQHTQNYKTALICLSIQLSARRMQNLKLWFGAACHTMADGLYSYIEFKVLWISSYIYIYIQIIE